MSRPPKFPSMLSWYDEPYTFADLDERKSSAALGHSIQGRTHVNDSSVTRGRMLTNEWANLKHLPNQMVEQVKKLGSNDTAWGIWQQGHGRYSDEDRAGINSTISELFSTVPTDLKVEVSGKKKPLETALHYIVGDYLGWQDSYNGRDAAWSTHRNSTLRAAYQEQYGELPPKYDRKGHYKYDDDWYGKGTGLDFDKSETLISFMGAAAYMGQVADEYLNTNAVRKYRD